MGSLCSESERLHSENWPLLGEVTMKSTASNQETGERKVAPGSLADLTIIFYDTAYIMLMVSFLVITFY